MAEDIQVRIKTAIDTLDAAKGVGDLKSSLRELKGLALETGDSNSAAFQQITRAIGETNDKVSDLNAVIKSQSGEPIENLSNSFRGLKGNLMNLDLKGVRQQFGVFSDTLKDFSGNVFSGFNVQKNYNRALAETSSKTQAAKIATMEFSAALAATGFGVLIIALGAIIANFDKLEKVGGGLGLMFKGVSAAIDDMTTALKYFSDAFELTNFKQQEQDKKLLKSLNFREKAVTMFYQKEIELADASGESTEQLYKNRDMLLLQTIKNEQDALSKKEEYGDEEIAEANRLAQLKYDIEKDALIRAAKLTKQDKDDKEKQSQKNKDDKVKQNEKNKQTEEKYKKELADLNTKYILNERQQLEKKFTDDLDKIKGNSELEKKLRLEIESDKAIALKSFDEKVKADQLAKDKELKDKQKALDDIAFEANKKKLEDDELLIQDDLQKQLEFLDAHYQEKGMTDNQYFVARAKLVEDINKKEKESAEDITKKQKEENDKRFESEKKARDEKFQIAQDFVSAASGLADIVSTIEMAGLKQGTAEYEKAARRKFEISKALQLSTAIITGIQSVMDAYANGVKNPVPLLGLATGTAYAIVAGIGAAANIAKIASTQYKSTSGAATPPPSTPAGGGPTSQAPAGLQAPSTIGLGQMTISPQAQKNNWQKVYVVESDIRNTTNRVEVIENRSVLGS
jgi:hypothetical protein